MMEKVQQAIILAAGQGVRLRPYTNTTPKPLLPVNGIPMLETLIECLYSAGIKRIIVVTGYMHEKFEYLIDKYGVELRYNSRYLSMNNISSLYAVKDALNCTTMIMDADQIIANTSIIRTEIAYSGYTAYYTVNRKHEWGLITFFNNIINCNRDFAENAYVLQSLSYWTHDDACRLSSFLTEDFLNKYSDKYWDDIALFIHKRHFMLSVFPVQEGDLLEIDTTKEYEDINNEKNR